MERITGNGAPTRTTAGVVGQHYEDLNSGYIWKLKVTGEDLEDHAAIFGSGSYTMLAVDDYYLVDTNRTRVTKDELLQLISTKGPLIIVKNYSDTEISVYNNPLIRFYDSIQYAEVVLFNETGGNAKVDIVYTAEFTSSPS